MVDTLCTVLRADQAQMFSLPASLGDTYWHVGANIDPAGNVAYATEFAAEDVWAVGGRQRKLLTVGRVSLGEEFIDRRDYLRSRFYNDFLKVFDIDRFLNVMLPGPSNSSQLTTFSFFRSSGKASFGPVETSMLRRLTPHLTLAMRLFWSARAHSVDKAILHETLDAVRLPLVLIDFPAKISYANKSAERELHSGDYIKSVRGNLELSHSVRERKGYARVLSNLYDGRSSTICLTTGKSVRGVYLCASPLSESNKSLISWSLGRGLIWLLPLPPAESGIDRIAMLFELTTAERRLLSIVAHGLSLSEAAKELGISIHTARSQLKAIQRKSGWRSQIELLRMVQQLSIISPR